jgi:hypothetical protein
MAAGVDVRTGGEGGPFGALGAGLLSAALFGAALPVLPALAVASPLPLLVTRLRAGRASAWLSALAAAVLLGTVFTAGSALAYLALFVTPALFVAESTARGRGLLRGCALGFAFLTGELLLALLFAPEWMAARALGALDLMRSPQFLEGLSSAGYPREQLDKYVHWTGLARSVLEVVYPAAFVILGGVVVLLNTGLFRLWLRRHDAGWLEEGEFEGLRLSFGLVPAFVLAGLGVLSPALRTASYNALVLLAFFFLLQGLAIAAYFAARLAGPAFLRWALGLLVLLNPLAPHVLVLLGLFDHWLDFRKWADPPRGDEA